MTIVHTLCVSLPAGTVMFEYGMRLGREVRTQQGLQKQVNCYLAALNCLRLIRPQYAWIVQPSTGAVVCMHSYTLTCVCWIDVHSLLCMCVLSLKLCACYCSVNGLAPLRRGSMMESLLQIQVGVHVSYTQTIPCAVWKFLKLKKIKIKIKYI